MCVLYEQTNYLLEYFYTNTIPYSVCASLIKVSTDNQPGKQSLSSYYANGCTDLTYVYDNYNIMIVLILIILILIYMY